MNNHKKRKTWRTFTEDLIATRRRPFTDEQIARINKVFEKDVAAENKKPVEPGKKIPVDSDSGVDV